MNLLWKSKSKNKKSNVPLNSLLPGPAVSNVPSSPNYPASTAAHAATAGSASFPPRTNDAPANNAQTTTVDADASFPEDVPEPGYTFQHIEDRYVNRALLKALLEANPDWFGERARVVRWTYECHRISLKNWLTEEEKNQISDRKSPDWVY